MNLGRSYLITTIKGLLISKGLFGVILDQKANEIYVRISALASKEFKSKNFIIEC